MECFLYASNPQVDALVSLFATIMGKRPAFRVHGGSNAENLALQNIQVIE